MQKPEGAGEPATSRLGAFGALVGEEMDGLTHLAGEERTLDRGATLWVQGKRLPNLFILLDGWMASVVATGDGREMTAKIHLPGDLLGLPSIAFATATETITALTPTTLRPLALHSFGHLFEAHPRVAAMMFLVSQQERATLMDRLTSCQRGQPVHRVAAFFCQLLTRIRWSHPETTDSFFMPLGRQQVADLVGIGPSGLAAALDHLRGKNVMGWTRRTVTIADERALAALARLPERELVLDPHWFPAISTDH